jgi:phosphoglycerate dehydrogenase-like enzyme
MLLSLTRGIQKYYIPRFNSKQWHPERTLVEIQGGTMGIVGLGGLGQATAKIAKSGLDMRVLAVDAKPMAKPVFVDEFREPGWLLEMVPQVDVLVCSCPFVPPMQGRPASHVTRGLISDQVLRALKKTAYFILISRADRWWTIRRSPPL